MESEGGGYGRNLSGTAGFFSSQAFAWDDFLFMRKGVDYDQSVNCKSASGNCSANS